MRMAACGFGWDLVHKLAEKDLKKKEDVLMLFLHWHLVKSGLQCVGLGDDKNLPVSEGSEVLPDGWNESAVYALRYVHNKKLYIVHGTKTEGDIVFNLLRVFDMKVTSVSFKIDDTVKSLKGKLDDMIPKNSEVADAIKKELMNPVFSGINKDSETQTSQQPDVLPRVFHEDDPLRVGPPRRPEPAGIGARWDPLRDPLSVGRSDLDPFARGGGMIFDPFAARGGRGGFREPDPSGIPGGLPRGAIPPGARFDPVGPPGFGPRPPGRGFSQPDHDHLPPPGYDDMFM